MSRTKTSGSYTKGNTRGGRRAGVGRPKGSPNKVTGQARAMFQAFVDGRSAEVDELWNQVARGRTVKHGNKTIHIPADPVQALNILGRLAEYVLPRLNRTEVTGLDGSALVPPNIAITFDAGGPGAGGVTQTDDEDDASPTAEDPQPSDTASGD